MIRRRRPKPREMFSFDSFLDVVANVVGIIIRLILVVWVGARSYSSLAHRTLGEIEPLAPVPEVREEDEPIYTQLKTEQQVLQHLREQMLEQLKLIQGERDARLRAEPQELALKAQVDEAKARSKSEIGERDQGKDVLAKTSLTTAAIQERSKRLTEQILALERQPVPKRTLHYRTPISRPVQSDEFHFELQQGRVAFIDVFGLLEEFSERREEIEKQLQGMWQVHGTFGPIGAYRMQYTVERERGLLDAIADQGTPSGHQGFRYGLSAWKIEPVTSVRGEDVEDALQPGSSFRQLADRLDPGASAVTFWIYPDSFAAFRRIRDFLYERGITVAGRPLPTGIPIASSRKGTASRGQ